MYGCLLLLALAISPLAPQQQTIRTSIQTKTIGQVCERIDNLSVILSDTRDKLITHQDNVLEEAAKVEAQNEQLLVDFADLVKTVQVTQNVTSQLLVDLQVLKGRQAVAGAIQGAQVFMFLAYLSTIFVFYLGKHCKKHHEKVAKEEFEVLYQASRSKRRAAAARAAKQAPQ